MFRRIHGQRGGQYQHENDKNRGDDLVFPGRQDFTDHIEGIVIRIDAEQVEDTHDAQHPEYHESLQEKERQDRQQFDNSVKGQEITQNSLPAGHVFIQKVRRPDPEGVLDAENAHRHRLHGEHHSPPGRQFIKGLKEQAHNIDHDGRDDHEVKQTGYGIFPVPDLYEVKHPAAQPFLLVIAVHGSLT